MTPKERLKYIKESKEHSNTYIDSEWLIARIEQLEETLETISENTGHAETCKPKELRDCYAGCEVVVTAEEALNTDPITGEK